MEYFIRFNFVGGREYCYDCYTKEKLEEEFKNLMEVLKKMDNSKNAHSILHDRTIINYANVISIEAIDNNEQFYEKLKNCKDK